MLLRYPATALTGLALALSSGPQTAPTPKPGPSAAPTAPPTPTGADPSPAGDPLTRAIRAARRGDLEEAARLLEQVVAARPDDRQALLMLAEVTTQRALRLERPASSSLWLEAAETMRRLAAAHTDLGPGERLVLSSALYNEACARAVDGQARKALGALAEAIDADFDLVELLETDPDLASLRALPRFRELKTTAVRKARIRARERATRSLAGSEPYRFDFELPDLGGKTVASSDFKGKVAIVNIWGTWCPPCRRLVPRLVELLEKEGKRGLAVVGIHYERVPAGEVNATVEAFVAKNKVPYPCLLGDDKTRGRIPRFDGFPTTLFLDRAGTVRLTVPGELRPLDLEAVTTLLLDEGASQAVMPRESPAGRPVGPGTPLPMP